MFSTTLHDAAVEVEPSTDRVGFILWVDAFTYDGVHQCSFFNGRPCQTCFKPTYCCAVKHECATMCQCHVIGDT
jgi:hypothetical protein